jgi:Trk K+ transport system NAD-binding subunit
MGEIWEIRIEADSVNVGRTIKELNIPEESSIIAVVRGDELIYDASGVRLEANDVVLIYVASANIRKIEHIFYL